MSTDDLHALFNPKSIALVGVPRGFKAGAMFMLGLVDQGFAGPIYPVHPHATEIGGLRAYPRLIDVPDPVDMVIVLTPREAVWSILDQCAAKKVKVVVLYTSGYGETGEDKGREEEKRMRQSARNGDFRILGPNCMGVYSPASGLAFFPGMPRTPGDLGFISQSGSIGNLFTGIAAQRKVFFRHVVSYGNASDIGLPELISYMGDDPEVRVICSYCEGVRDGKALIEAFRGIGGSKPIIMWKVGTTEAGRKAAASHTGSMSGRERIWEAVFRKHGIIEVSDIEELLDAVMAFYHLPLETRGRVVIVSGPGGPAVSAADTIQKCGLEPASLGEQTIQKLKTILPATGTSLRNPIDVGLSATFDLRLYLDSLDAIAQDKNVDAIVILGRGASREMNEQYVESLIRAGKSSGKAIIAIAFPGMLTEEELLEPLYEAGIPVYPTPERAIRAYAKLWRFHRFRSRE